MPKKPNHLFRVFKIKLGMQICRSFWMSWPSWGTLPIKSGGLFLSLSLSLSLLMFSFGKSWEVYDNESKHGVRVILFLARSDTGIGRPDTDMIRCKIFSIWIMMVKVDPRFQNMRKQPTYHIHCDNSDEETVDLRPEVSIVQLLMYDVRRVIQLAIIHDFYGVVT